MIQRKDSLGYMDIMRGKYKVTESDYIKKQLRGMTRKERDSLLNDDFEEMWYNLWGSDTESSQRYAHDRLLSKQKLSELRNGVETTKGGSYTLADLLRQEPPIYETPEWGFPKGRRDPFETDIQCAYRELWEETSISEDELLKLINVSPFIEQFYGSNDIHYRHSYYLAQYVGNRDISFDLLNPEMTREIGDMAWKNLDEALLVLRPENVEKRGVIVQLANLLRNYAPVFREPLTGERLGCGTENSVEEQQEQYVFRSRKYTSAAVGSSTRGIRCDRTSRFFGGRQTTRRISDVRGTNTSQHGQGYGARGAAGDRGAPVSGYRRQNIFVQTSTEERISRDASSEDN
jgi:8-oxo-dGTP pyrophosphatase MutT (NUDIX family)